MAKDDDDKKPDPFESGMNDAAERLDETIKQVEELQAEIEERQGDIRELMRELGGMGYDTKQVRRVIAVKKARRQNLAKWEADEQVFSVYMNALGMTPNDY